jgi:hypothetical protein
MVLQAITNVDYSVYRSLRNGRKTSTLYACVHPFWNLYFGNDLTHHDIGEIDSGGEQLSRGGVASLEGILNVKSKKGMRSFNKFRRIRYSAASKKIPSLFGDENEGDYHSNGLDKTRAYLSVAYQFLSSLDALRQAVFLDHLKKTETPLLLLLPRGLEDAASTNLQNSFKRYLDDFGEGAKSIFYLETSSYSTGHFLMRDEINRQAATKLLTGLDIKNIKLFGGNLNQCLVGAEEDFKSISNSPVEILMDVSSSWFLNNVEGLTRAGGTLPDALNYGGDQKLFISSIQRLIEMDVDFSFLRRIPHLLKTIKLEILEAQTDLVSVLMDLKKASIYEHSNLGNANHVTSVF